MPKVSVITCTYNRAHLIGETIASVLTQSFQDFEYIIIDDGSVDNTEEVVNTFQDARIRYFFHTHTAGHLSALRNFAHAKSNGAYVAYVDSDDLWEKDKLEIQFNALEGSRTTGFSFTDIDTFDDNGSLQTSLYKKTGEFTGSVFSEMLANNLIICHTTLMIRKSCLDKIGTMDESMHSGDHDLVFLLSRHFDAHVVYRPLVHVRKHAQNSTGNPALSLILLEEHHKTLRKLFQQKLISNEEFKRAYALTSYSFGVQVMKTQNYPVARQYFLKCVSNRPYYWKAWARLVLMLPKQVVGI